jgi:predicted RNase H-like nuclease (RuvC/YqgF family)
VNTAVAILDLSGGLLDVRSARGFSFGEILDFISGRCTPLMIASDVSAPSRLLEKVASAFSADIYRPPGNYSKRSKSRLVSQFCFSERERHAKDALAAAVSAYEYKLPLLRKIEKRLRENGIFGQVDVGDVAMRLMSGQSRNIKDALDSITTEMTRLHAA